MLNVALAVIAVLGGLALVKAGFPGSRGAVTAQLSDRDFSSARIVMYSLTTCRYCNIKRAELHAKGIPFVEYFIDTDPARNEELFKKLHATGYLGGVGTPTFEVNGKLLPNNPSLATIIKHL